MSGLTDRRHAALASFHPLVQAWFAGRFGTPTDAQARAWPAIATGEHVLLTAPTGSGKTLTAFLWALDALLTGRYVAGTTRVLYVSPLKALNTDIRDNLERPLQELQAAFAAAGMPACAPRVRTRSGDTPAGERARMLRQPPEILITTPESLNLMLTGTRGRAALAGLDAVIIDEVHDLIGNRRGVQLATALERLACANGEFQRIALSATVQPLERVAAWVGGRRLVGPRRAASHVARTVRTLRAGDRKEIDLQVRFPPAAATAGDRGEPIWRAIAADLRTGIEARRATLVFTNSRRLAEQLTWRINDGDAEPLAYAHHGSLAREVRTVVEARLKAGELRAIVATSSLELGIDVGAIDQVVLLQTPPAVASALQRVGRAGHQVGAVSHGTLVPSHGRDALLAAAMVEAVDQRDIEAAAPLCAPLDMLTQLVLSMSADATWQIDEMLAVIRCAAPYAELADTQFELVLGMLSGRYAGGRRRVLAPRLAVDRERNTVRALRSGVLALYRAGGSIPDRGYYALRQYDTNARIGELDEEFVWEAKVGQVFALGSRNWRIHRISHDDVLVEPTRAAPSTPPFWRSEGMNRSHHFALRVATALEQFDARLEAPQGAVALHDELCSARHFDRAAATLLVDYLVDQREHTQRPLPHRHALLIEEVHSAPGGYAGPEDECQLLLHTLWGGRVNRPLGLVLVHAWRERFGETPQLHVADDLIALQTRVPCDPATLVELLLGADIDGALRTSLEASPFFGARFRECAGRALLLAPRRFDRRQPLWLTRQTAKQLLEELADAPDFPILLETWRTCLQDEFDLPALRARLDELGSGVIGWSHCRVSRASPFGADLVFNQVSRYMYADDAPLRDSPSALDDAMLASLRTEGSMDGGGSQRFDAELLERHARRRARLEPGWLPADAEELADWVRERVALADTEMLALERAVLEGHPGEAGTDALRALTQRLCTVRTTDGRTFTCARDVAPAWVHASVAPLALSPWRPVLVAATMDPHTELQPAARDSRDHRDAASLVAELLAFQPPRRRRAVIAGVPLPAEQAGPLLDDLCARGVLVAGDFLPSAAPAGADTAIGPATDTATDTALDDDVALCTRDTLTTLLRIRRSLAREAIRAEPLTRLPAFLADWQGFGGGLDDAIAALSGSSATAAAWESELLPARVPGYAAHELDAALRAGDCAWRGSGERMLTLVLPDDLHVLPPSPAADGTAATFGAVIDPDARYDFHQLADRQALPSPEFSRLFWDALWRGTLCADDFTVVREGLERDFVLPATNPAGPRPGSRAAARARARGWPGLFRQVRPQAQGLADALDQLEHAKAVARLLLQRYGVLNRELFARERLVVGWSAVFRALRLMELAGEVNAGEFVRGLAVPQFAGAAAAARLAAAPRAASFWCGATDPISPCGLGDASTSRWPLPLPRRLAGNLLVFTGGALVATIEGRGRRLRLAADAPGQALAACIPALLALARQQGRLALAEIDGAAAADCPWLAALDTVFRRSTDHRGQVELARA